MKKQLAYSIHPSTGVSLVIAIDEVEVGEGRVKWIGKKGKLFHDHLMRLVKEGDRDVLETLIREKRRSGLRESLETIDFSTITIDHKKAIAVLKELAATGQLYYKQNAIIPNFFGAVDLHYEISKEGVIRGIVKLRSSEYDVADCDLLAKGTPNWLIKGNTLQLFREDLTWKWLRPFCEERVWRIDQRELGQMIEELKEEEDLGAPKLIHDGHLSQDPTPVIKLTDQSGAFANLLFDYGKGECVSFEALPEKWRQLESEKGMQRDLLEGGFIQKQVGRANYYCPLDRVAKTLQFFIELGWCVQTSEGQPVVAQSKVDLSLQAGKEEILVRGAAQFGEDQVKLSDMIARVKSHDHFVPLSSGKVGLIDFSSLANTYSGLMEGELCAAGVKIKKHDLATLDELLSESVELAPGGGLRELAERLKGMREEKRLAPGPGFTGKLRVYQEEGVAWLSFLYRSGLHGILADDMGLGKTVQVIAFLSTIELDRPLLIVAPTSLLFHWKREFESFCPALSVAVHHGSDRAREALVDSQVILTSYSLLRRDSELFKEIAFQCLILDEAQAIKNAKSQAAKVARGLNSQFRLSITGTPVENHLGELLSQFDFLIPGLFQGGEVELRSVKRKVKPFILRRRKADVDEQLPEKIEQTVWLEMHPEQRAVYEEFLAKIKKGVLKKVDQEGLGRHRMEIFEAILRLRQICCHPLLVDSLLEEAPRSTKSEALFEDLETLVDEGQKALVYSQFTSMLQLMRRECQARGWKFVSLDGSTKNREEVVGQFQENPETQLLLISLKAGGVGLNLTAADYVILYEPWWNVAVENQAIDRAHRIGRHDPVIAKRYVFRDTIEERMMLLKESKRALAEDLFDQGGGVGGWSEEDLDFLLG